LARSLPSKVILMLERWWAGVRVLCRNAGPDLLLDASAPLTHAPEAEVELTVLCEEAGHPLIVERVDELAVVDQHGFDGQAVLQLPGAVGLGHALLNHRRPRLV
jgi:hypothetical protein